MRAKELVVVLLVVVISALLGTRSAPDKRFEQQILAAAESDNQAEVQRLLAIDRRLANTQDRDGVTPLHLAVCRGYVGLAELLIANGAKLNNREGFAGDTPLHEAAASCQPDVVKLLLDKGAKVNLKNDGSELPIHAAVLAGNRDAVEFLLQAGARLDCNDDLGYNIVQEAALTGRLRILERLLNKGLSPSGQGNKTWTPLQLASRQDDLKIAKLLIDRGAKINETDAGENPLHMAAERGRTNMVALLLSEGAQPDIFVAAGLGDTNRLKFLLDVNGNLANARDSNSWTPLHWAAYADQTEAAELLLKKRAAVNAHTDLSGSITRPPISPDGDCPLHCAAIQGHRRMAALLLKNGADINARGESQETPLTLAVRFGHSELANDLVSTGAALNLRNAEGHGPLDLAVKSGNEPLVRTLLGKKAELTSDTLCFAALSGNKNVVEWFLAAGADPRGTNSHGSNPLREAARGDHRMIAQLLKEWGAELDLFSACAFGNVPQVASLLGGDLNQLAESDELRWSPLHFAANCGNTQVLAFLLSMGANPTGRGVRENGEWFALTPLRLACVHGEKAAAECLIACGACLEDRDPDGCTALQWAVAERRRDIVEWLLERGADPNAMGGAPGYGVSIQTRRRGAFKPRLRPPRPGTPLDYAILQDNKGLVRLLLKYGANINLPANEPLLFCVSIGNAEMAEFLIENGADPQAKIWLQRRNYLHIAGLRGYPAVTDLLIKHHVDVNAKDRFGETPLEYALHSDHEEVARLLRGQRRSQ